MFDPAFLEACADPGIRIEIVERFLAAMGSENPLAISITSGNRVILPEPPKTPEEAARLAQRFVGSAVVRAGVTAFPIGVGISDASEITADIFDACKNIGMGTALFGKVYRIVAHAHGAEDAAVYKAALESWRTGEFENTYVFVEPDPGPLQTDTRDMEAAGDHAERVPVEDASPLSGPAAVDPYMAGMRVTLPAHMGE